MTEEEQQERKEEVRRTVRAYLAERPNLAFLPRAIAHSPFVQAKTEEVEAALSVLLQLGQVQQVKDSLGATSYWKATGAGILAHERQE